MKFACARAGPRLAASTAWENAQQQQAQDPATARLADAVLSRRVQLVLQAHAATVQFNQAVARYNEAIGQFPALLLALLFGFKPARPLPQVMVASLN